MSKSIQDRVDAADRGESPTVICRMKSGYLVLSDMQSPRGWCILIRVPVVDDLNDLDEPQQAQFLTDMAAAGDALAKASGAYRINYSILGNTDPALHAHIHPRFRDEPDDLRRQPLWAIWRHLDRKPFDAQREAPLMAEIKMHLKTAGRVAE
ncbi:MAG TPA: hypothetical protein VF595_15400 [Tepidisphaeraceae bacterium]|jgi:diadenosine tetraphosphate (Ap4A) HIT family hydrolase